MFLLIDLTKTNEYMITQVYTKEDGEEDRRHAWCKDKKELITWIIQNTPDAPKEQDNGTKRHADDGTRDSKGKGMVESAPVAP